MAARSESFGRQNTRGRVGPRGCALADTSPAVLWVASMSCDNSSPSSISQETRCCLLAITDLQVLDFLLFCFFLNDVAKDCWVFSGRVPVGESLLCLLCGSRSQVLSTWRLLSAVTVTPLLRFPPTAGVAPDPSCATTPPPPGGLWPLGTGCRVTRGNGTKVYLKYFI